MANAIYHNYEILDINPRPGTLINNMDKIEITYKLTHITLPEVTGITNNLTIRGVDSDFGGWTDPDAYDISAYSVRIETQEGVYKEKLYTEVEDDELSYTLHTGTTFSVSLSTRNPNTMSVSTDLGYEYNAITGYNNGVVFTYELISMADYHYGGNHTGTDMVMWYDANGERALAHKSSNNSFSYLPTENAQIRNWYSRIYYGTSNNIYDLTLAGKADITKQPFYNAEIGALEFDDVDDYMWQNDWATVLKDHSEGEFIVVAENIVDDSHDLWLSMGDGSLNSLFQIVGSHHNNKPFVDMFHNYDNGGSGGQIASTIEPHDGFMSFSFSSDGNDYRMFLNGREDTGFTKNSSIADGAWFDSMPTPTKFFMGRSVVGSQYYFTCNIKELMYFKRRLTDTERTEILDYLHAKNNIVKPKLWLSARNSGNFDFNLAEITKWKDLSGNGYDFVKKGNGPTLIGGNVVFDGTNDSLESPLLLNAIKDDDQGELIAVLDADLSDYNVIMELTDGSINNIMHFVIYHTGNYAYCDMYFGGIHTKFKFPPNLGAGHHVITWSSNASRYQMTIDGVVGTLVIEAGSNDGKWFSSLSGLNDLTMGGGSDRNNVHYLLNLKDLYYFDYELSRKERDSMLRGIDRKHNTTLNFTVIKEIETNGKGNIYNIKYNKNLSGNWVDLNSTNVFEKGYRYDYKGTFAPNNGEGYVDLKIEVWRRSNPNDPWTLLTTRNDGVAYPSTKTLYQGVNQIYVMEEIKIKYILV